jgi:hypothetical protein
MPRHWDIRLIVVALLGAAALALVILLQNFSLINVLDENVVYIDTTVGETEDEVRDEDDNELGPQEDPENRDQSTLDPIDEPDL